MQKNDSWDRYKQTPMINMTPLVDVVFLALAFFMTISIYSQNESQLNISVPKSKEAVESTRSPGEITINVTKDGQFYVNQQVFDLAGLETMLKQVTKMYPDQPVIVRADEKTYHKYVINVLDACMHANIWDVSFSTAPDAR